MLTVLPDKLEIFVDVCNGGGSEASVDACWLAVWLSGNALASINIVALRQTELAPGCVTICGCMDKPSRYVTRQLGRLSLLPSVGW